MSGISHTVGQGRCAEQQGGKAWRPKSKRTGRNPEEGIGLAGVTELVERCPLHRKVAGSIPRRDSYPG